MSIYYPTLGITFTADAKTQALADREDWSNRHQDISARLDLVVNTIADLNAALVEAEREAGDITRIEESLWMHEELADELAIELGKLTDEWDVRFA